jgi:hypothetical protein
LAGGITAALLPCLFAANVKVESFTCLRLFFKSPCFFLEIMLCPARFYAFYSLAWAFEKVTRCRLSFLMNAQQRRLPPHAPLFTIHPL